MRQRNVVPTPRRHRPRRLIAVVVVLLLVLLACGAAAAWLGLRASLPQLDGQAAAPGIAAPATIERDANGVVTVAAGNRLDLAYAAGYAHGQDRFFQMDLLRRLAAGEAAALAGPRAVALDRRNRLHRFRARARATYGALAPGQRRLLQRYAAGVNAALDALAAWPFEYIVLGVRPQPWRPEDTFLVIDAMYLDLQAGELDRILARGYVRDMLAPDLARFLLPRGSKLDAPLDGGQVQAGVPALPAGRPDWLDSAAPPGPSAMGAAPDHGGGSAGAAPGDIGSNGFAIVTGHGDARKALVANDMHLGLQLPNIWYRMTLLLQGDGGRRISGVSLPGAPIVVAGSNGDVAWGFTNSYGHFIDLVRLQTDPADPARYRGPQGKWDTAVAHVEQIEVKGQAPVDLTVLETQWGPMLDAGGVTYAVDWMAYRPGATDLGLLRMENARTVDEALRVAQTSGVPTQNIVVAGRGGHIGWTLAGPLPSATRDSDGFPIDAERAGAQPLGRLAEQDYPSVVDPPSGRLWTANSTQLSDASRQRRIGDGGAAVGFRSTQIRDALAARDAFEAGDLLAIELDDRGLWLEFWRRLALEALDKGALANKPDRAAFRRLLEQWDGRAGVNAVGYTLVRDFREALYGAWFGGLDERLAARAPERAPAISIGRASSRLEASMRELARRRAWVPAGYADWRAFMLAGIDATIVRNRPRGASLADARWGERNRLSMGHLFSQQLPTQLRSWLSVPAQPLPGDRHMPRVQGRSFGASERFVVSPGEEDKGIMEMPGGASGHPLSPYFMAGHQAWADGAPSAFLPGPVAHRLVLRPEQAQEQDGPGSVIRP